MAFALPIVAMSSGCHMAAGLADLEIDTDAGETSSCGSPAQQNYLWQVALSGEGEQVVSGVAVGEKGEVIAVGWYSKTLEIDDDDDVHPATDSGTEGFIVRFEADGQWAWTTIFPGAADVKIHDVAAAAQGDIVVAGSYTDTIEYYEGNPEESSGGLDMFVARLASDGSLRWASSWGDGSDQVASAVHVDGGGNILVTGYIQGEPSLAKGGPLPTAGGDDAFILRMNDDTHAYSHQLGNDAQQRGLDVSSSPSGEDLLVGFFFGDIDVDPEDSIEPVESEGGSDGFLIQMAKDGGSGSVFGFGDSQAQVCTSLAVGTDNSRFFTGHFTGEIPLGDITLSGNGLDDVFLVRTVGDGTLAWGQRFGDDKIQRAHAVSVDDSYNIQLTGFIEGQARFGKGQPILSAAGGRDVFVASFDGLGNPNFSAVYGGAGNDEASSIANSSGDIIVGGSFEGCIDFGGGELESEGRDGFVAKLKP